MKLDNRGSAEAGGIGFFGMLGLIFIVLKLVGVINWSWVWVLAPFWITPVVVIILIALWFLFNR